MLPLLAAALLTQDPPEPPAPPAPPAGVRDVAKILDALRATIEMQGEDDRQILLRNVRGVDVEVYDGDPAEVVTYDVTGDNLVRRRVVTDPLRLSADRVVTWPTRSAAAPAVPTTGTLKLTAPDGTVTEYRAEFTPDPPAPPEPPVKARLGVAMKNFTPQGDPPGLVIFKVVEDSAAAKAGLKDGDRLISVGDEPLKSFRVLRLKVDEAAEGDTPLAIKVVREEGEGGDEPKAVKILRFQLKPAELKLDEDGAVAPRDGADYRAVLSSPYRVIHTPGFSLGPATVRPADAAAEADRRAAETLRRTRAEIDAGHAAIAAAEEAAAAARAMAAAEEAKGETSALVELRKELAALRAELDALKAGRDAGSDDE